MWKWIDVNSATWNFLPDSPTNDKFCEEQSHPHLFPTGKIGFQTKREVQLSPSKYFNQQLLNYTQKSSSDSDYNFFAQSVMQKFNLSNHKYWNEKGKLKSIDSHYT